MFRFYRFICGFAVVLIYRIYIYMYRIYIYNYIRKHTSDAWFLHRRLVWVIKRNCYSCLTILLGNMVKSELNTLFPTFLVPCYNTNVLNILLKPIDLEAYEYDVKLLRLTFALLLIFWAISRRFFVVFFVNTPRHWNEVNNGTLYLALVFSTFQFEWWGRRAKNSTWP